MDTLADRAPPDAIAHAARRLGCASVAYTYNDPVIFLEYAVETAAACREAGVRSVAVTAGYVCDEPRSDFFEWMDAANVDLKAFSDDFYRRFCSARLEPVLETLRHLARGTRVWLEITTLLIPGANDSDDEIHRASEWIVENLGRDVPWHFTAFHPAHRMRDRPPTPVSTVIRARSIARGHGLRHVYTGNAFDPAGQGTRCGQCGADLIGRRGYEITAWGLTDAGRCRECGARCAGVFRGPPGDWGSRRRAVRLSEGGSRGL